MEDLTKMPDHDLLIMMHEQIKGIKKDIQDLKEGDIKELKSGTALTLANHEARLKDLERFQIKSTQDAKDNKRYMALVVGMGLLMLGMLIYHMTGYNV